MQLRDALEQIEQIRSQMDRVQTFRGYRSVMAAMSATLAVIVAGGQLAWGVNPAEQPAAFILPWLGAAALSVVMAGAEIAWRLQRGGSAVQRQLSLLAAEQFLPAAVAGVLVTFVIWDFVPGAMGLVAGLWMVFFSLSLFASARVLPRMIFGVAGFYLLCGVASLAISPRVPAGAMVWEMGAVFFVGQLLAAGVLYLKLERCDG